MTKKTQLAKAVIPKPAAPSPVEAFVEGGRAAQEAGGTALATISGDAPDAEATKRLTLDIPESLHKRLKIHCAIEDVTIADVIREILRERFPAA